MIDIDVQLNPASRTMSGGAENSDHNFSLLRSGAKEARDFADSLLKHCEILEKEAELRAEASVVSASSAYRCPVFFSIYCRLELVFSSLFSLLSQNFAA